MSKSSLNEINTDKKLKVIKNRCPQNHPCPSMRVCKPGALTQKGFEAPIVNQDLCIQCGKCVAFCPKGAIILE